MQRLLRRADWDVDGVRDDIREECFKQAKQETGLDHYQVRTWRGW
jgi:SRSO17 transposase